MRFDDQDQYTYILSDGISPYMNFDTFAFSVRTTFIFFLNEDINYLIVNIIYIPLWKKSFLNKGLFHFLYCFLIFLE